LVWEEKKERTVYVQFKKREHISFK